MRINKYLVSCLKLLNVLTTFISWWPHGHYIGDPAGSNTSLPLGCSLPQVPPGFKEKTRKCPVNPPGSAADLLLFGSDSGLYGGEVAALSSGSRRSPPHPSPSPVLWSGSSRCGFRIFKFLRHRSLDFPLFSERLPIRPIIFAALQPSSFFRGEKQPFFPLHCSREGRRRRREAEEEEF